MIGRIHRYLYLDGFELSVQTKEESTTRIRGAIGKAQDKKEVKKEVTKQYFKGNRMKNKRSGRRRMVCGCMEFMVVFFLILGLAGTADSAEEWTRTGPEGGNVHVLAIDPVTPTTLYAGFWYNGLYKSTNGGATWSTAETGLPDTFSIQDIAINPLNRNILYAGTNNSGIYKSTNGGVSWGEANIGITSMDIGNLAIDPLTPTTLYATEDWGSILFKSTDGGVSWSASILGYCSVTDMVIDPGNPNTLYIGTNCGEVVKSTDGGENWNWSGNYVGSADHITTLAINPAASNTLYAGTWYGGVYKSTNGGDSWSASNTGLTSTLVHALVVDPSTPTIIYAGTWGGSVFKSTNAGGSWSPANSGASHEGFAHLTVNTFAINPSAPSTLYAGTAGGVFKTVNSGANWNATNSGMIVTNVYALAIDPLSPVTLYAGTFGGGVYKSTDGGRTWNAVNSGLTEMMVYSFAIDPVSPAILYAGTGAVFTRPPTEEQAGSSHISGFRTTWMKRTPWPLTRQTRLQSMRACERTECTNLLTVVWPGLPLTQEYRRMPQFMPWPLTRQPPLLFMPGISFIKAFIKVLTVGQTGVILESDSTPVLSVAWLLTLSSRLFFTRGLLMAVSSRAPTAGQPGQHRARDSQQQI